MPLFSIAQLLKKVVKRRYGVAVFCDLLFCDSFEGGSLVQVQRYIFQLSPKGIGPQQGAFDMITQGEKHRSSVVATFSFPTKLGTEKMLSLSSRKQCSVQCSHRAFAEG